MPRSTPPLTAIPVFYDKRMVANAQSFSPSAGKPREVVESWKAMSAPVEFKPFDPVTRAQLALAHSRYYVDGVLDGRVPNGFGNQLMEVANALPWMSGAMLATAREALTNGQVAIAPAAGFHHACYEHAAGYCTFNGLIVAARVLLTEGQVKRVGILDFDMHYGDGTAQIMRFLNLAHCIRHFTAGADYDRPEQAEEFLAAVPGIVQSFQDCDVILYQAGADPHIKDPLGGWLTSHQLIQRDLLVFEHCRALGIPIAWNLAGGYQSPLRRVLDIHDATLQMCVATYLAREETIIAQSTSPEDAIEETVTLEASEFPSELRELILEFARRPDVHSVSCQFPDRQLWEGLLTEQVKRAQSTGKPPSHALFLSGPDSGMVGIAKHYPGLEEIPEDERTFTGDTLEEQLGGKIHIPYEGVCEADFLVYPAWRKVHPERWQKEGARLESVTPGKRCNHLLIAMDLGEPECATRIGPIAGAWYLYSDKGPHKPCR